MIGRRRLLVCMPVHQSAKPSSFTAAARSRRDVVRGPGDRGQRLLVGPRQLAGRQRRSRRRVGTRQAGKQRLGQAVGRQRLVGPPSPKKPLGKTTARISNVPARMGCGQQKDDRAALAIDILVSGFRRFGLS
jgi:hypothetical protein